MNKRGIEIFNIDTNLNGIIDPDNVFWGITSKTNDIDNYNAFIPRVILSLYEKFKGQLDNELNDFRFSQSLSAVYIDPTDRCNANCPYCYVPARLRREGQQMSYEQLELILNKITQHIENVKTEEEKKRKMVIIFHASEPLLAKDVVFKAIENFGSQFHFGLQTNATLLTKEDVIFLKKHRVGVGVSLDSYKPKTNNRSRVHKDADNFKAGTRALEWFDGYEGLNVIATITKINVNDLPGIVKFLHKKKVPCVLLNPVRLTQKNSRSVKPDKKLMSKYFIQAVNTALELSKKSGRKIIIGNFSNVILAITSPAARRMMCDISPCGGGRCFFTITASGEMIPCGEFIGLKGFSGGNILAKDLSIKDEIQEALQSAPFKKIRSRIVENIPECNICAIRNICGAPCPAEMHSLGNMHKKSVFCEFYKDIIKHAFKIIAKKEEKYCFRNNNFQYEYELS